MVGFEDPVGLVGLGEDFVAVGYLEVPGGGFAEGWAGEGAGVEFGCGGHFGKSSGCAFGWEFEEGVEEGGGER